MKISRPAIFLFEVMVTILIFSLCAAICASVFVKAHSFSTRSEDLTMAVVKAQSAAETFKAGAEDAKQQTLNRDGVYTEYFDEDWERISGDDAEVKAAFGIYMTMYQGRALPVKSCKVEVRRLSEDGEDVSLLEFQVRRYTGNI